MKNYRLTATGPDVTALTHRLAECPEEFLAQPGSNQIHTAAVVSDLLEELGGQPLTADAAADFAADPGKPATINLLKLVQVCCYLYYDPWFREKGGYAPQVLEFLRAGLKEIAGILQADVFIRDPERREELARLCLAGLGLRPAGENESQAIDRLTTVDSVERKRLVEETRQAQERSRQLREAMARKAAQEAASKMTRE